LRHIIIIIALISLAGCAAALVPYTSDPKQKISDAYWLFDNKQRALPAQKLILEAIEIYKKNDNTSGLAEAYVASAVFLRSYAVDRHSEHYKETGFNNGKILFEDRYNGSIEYLKKSRAIYEKKEEYDNLTNTYMHMGFTYLTNDNIQEGCEMFIKSLEMNKLFMNKNPDAKLNLGGFKSYKDYIDNKMKLAKCPA
jgi:tetratricopeptide (TPR) repeat protein